MADKLSRQQEILQAFARELEQRPGERVTTAQLAKGLGVSEAALYRHFPSKARMFEGLLDFAEETLFGLVGRIVTEEQDPQVRCEKIITLCLGFSARNPGISSILTGTALTGETARLRQRSSQVFERLETQFRQVLRDAELILTDVRPRPVNETANLLLAVIEGRMVQFVRSGFDAAHLPTNNWSTQWQVLQPILAAYLPEN